MEKITEKLPDVVLLSQVGGQEAMHLAGRAATIPPPQGAASPGDGEAQVEIPAGKFSHKDVQEIVDALNKLMDINRSEVQFSLFQDPRALIIRVIDRQSGQIVREMPSEKILRMLQAFLGMLGLLLDQKA